MKQIFQNYNTGELTVLEVPVPQLKSGWVSVKNHFSLISAGTEKTKIDMGRKNLLEKARSRPDLVKKVIEKAKREGIWKTWQTVSQRLNHPVALGYSCAGVVTEVGDNVEGIRRGDLVACGGEFANHAEMVSVPKNLVAKLPAGVKSEHGAFATVGAIALQGVRQADVRIGEKVAVIGLGLLGLLTAQILRASGCEIIGIDLDPEKVARGKKNGCRHAFLVDQEDMEEGILIATDGYGVDATIITAGSASNGPIEMAGEITREKGRVIVVGAVGMNIPREPYYLKEIDLKISRSYGPGRYDKAYEDKGQDYPFPYVRFTEQRNMRSFLELVEDGRIDLDSVITHIVPFEDAERAYSLIEGEKKEQYLGILLRYDRDDTKIPRRIDLHSSPMDRTIVLGVIGAGNYATTYLLPHLKSNPSVCFGGICTSTGMTALARAKTFGFQYAESDVERIYAESDAILIATRHNDHAYYALKALRMGKSVFVEKPLVLKAEELDEFISLACDGVKGTLMVGFNRRFSPLVAYVREHLGSTGGPKQVLIRVNAGYVPRDHWIQDPEVGGGRLIGEACHFIDLVVAFTGASVESVSALAIPRRNLPPLLWDDFSISLGMSDGSVGTIVYSSIGDSGLPKEYIEIYCGGKVGIIDDFRTADIWSKGKREKKKSPRQDKGQQWQMDAWVQGLKNGASPIPFHQIVNVHKTCLMAVESMKRRQALMIE
jgi:polar amino acid transport system substrate-binding protein